MASFKTVLTNSGAAALTLAMYRGETVFPDYAAMGSGVFEGSQATVTNLVGPVDVDVRVMDRVFIEAEGEEPAKLQISLQTMNTGLTELTPIREILLYANSISDDDSVIEPGIPFAYAWLVGDDTDNILPPPLNPGAGIHDTVHFHDMVIFTTNQEIASIEVNFAFNAFVTHRYLNERLAGVGGVEVSDANIPSLGTKVHHRIIEEVPLYQLPFLAAM